jgi:hypothetical protein
MAAPLGRGDPFEDIHGKFKVFGAHQPPVALRHPVIYSVTWLATGALQTTTRKPYERVPHRHAYGDVPGPKADVHRLLLRRVVGVETGIKHVRRRIASELSVCSHVSSSCLTS